MRVFRGLPNPASRTPCALTIGNFDGVHRGHRALIERVRTAADQLAVPACVMTFEPHPREYFHARLRAEGRLEDPASKPPARIANLRDKLEALAACGIDRVIVERFNARFAVLSAEHFVEDIVVAGCHARWLMVGDDFRFGAQRRGGFAMLEDAGERFGFAVESLASVTTPKIGTVDDGADDPTEERVSSSAIRAALAAGDLTRAEQLLGHPYFISGHVIHGQKLGRTIGFPTANILPHGHATDRQTALSGIFVVRVHGAADAPLPGVASLGVRPDRRGRGSRAARGPPVRLRRQPVREARARRVPAQAARRGEVRRHGAPDRGHRRRCPRRPRVVRPAAGCRHRRAAQDECGHVGDRPN